ncbi:MAG: hypothetical protein N2749_04310 [Clostridia bacterium]|nr:hypothetical protein [Clostridia bacterium]
MKINIVIKKLLFSFIFAFFLSFIANSCHAYNITARTIVVESNGESYLVYRTSVSAHTTSVQLYDTWKKNYPTEYANQGQWAKRGDHSGLFDKMPTYYSISGQTVIFHSSPNTKYISGDDYTYETYESVPLGDSVTERNKISNIKTGINLNVQTYEALYTLKNFNDYRIKITGSGTTKTMISEYRIDLKESDNIIKAFKTKLGSKYTVDTPIYFSNVYFTKKNAYASQTNYPDDYLLNIRTASQFFNLDRVKGRANSDWSSSDTSGYVDWNKSVSAPQQSIINKFDNIIILPQPKYREVYVRHINASTGAILTDFGSKSLIDSNNKTISSIGGKTGFNAFFQLELGTGISKLSYDSRTSYSGKIVTYNGMKASTKSTNSPPAISATGLNSSKNATLTSGNTADFTFIDFYYTLTTPPIPPDPTPTPLPSVSIIGSILFDAASWQYGNSTTSTSVDYIPSSESLISYVGGAYPYILRALNYSTAQKTGSVGMSVEVSKSYTGTYYYWAYKKESYGYSLNSNNLESFSKYSIVVRYPTTATKTQTNPYTLGSGETIKSHSISVKYYDTKTKKYETKSVSPGYSLKTGESYVTNSITVEYPTTATKTVTDSSYSLATGESVDSSDIEVKYRTETTTSGTKSKTLNYSVPYKYDYYRLNNFKMYRISNFELYDDDSNKGGELFNQGTNTYTINTSSSYNSRFSEGIKDVDSTLRYYNTFGNSTYGLGTNTAHCGWDSTCKDLADTTKSDVDKVTYSGAASGAGIGVTFTSQNDYVTVESSQILRPLLDSKTVYFSATTNGTLPEVNINTQNESSYTSNARSFYTPSTRTYRSDFVDQTLTIPEDRTNGMRYLTGKIYYNITTASNFNKGSDSFYDSLSRGNVSSGDFTEQSKTYDIHSGSSQNVNKVNVLTPISIASDVIRSDAIINQTDSAQGYSIIQKNTPFEITPRATSYTSGSPNYNGVDTNKFVHTYFISFDFDIENYSVYNAYGSIITSNTGKENARTWIEIPKGGKIRAQAAADVINTEGVNVVYQNTNNYYIRAITVNAPFNLKDAAAFIQYLSTSSSNPSASDGSTLVDNEQNTIRGTESQRRQSNYYDRNDVYADSNHMAQKTFTTTNLGRIFDFKITDCTDINFKDTFRKTDANGINVSSGKYFYSGLLKWDMTSLGTNNMVNRPATETGTASEVKRTLPLGPYKQVQYINAPKMGYRISFDLKTTGSLPNLDNRYVDITPEYYYISKTGQTIKDVTLYYKNSSGKYVPLAGSGYSIYFKPNDGYRYLVNLGYTNNYTNMSSSMEMLRIDGTMRLTKKMMSISANTFVQAWYGEFKLPNSTIAIERGTSDLNKPLKDGYIGVKFNIVCVDNPSSNPVRLGYSYNNKVQGTTTEIPNTSQWDYEGYLGFTKAGQTITDTNYLVLQLEKGTLRVIDQATYSKVKGTVVLFDLDSRAATDFE